MFYVLSILIQLQEEWKNIGLGVIVLALYISLLFFYSPQPLQTGKPEPDCFNRIQWKQDSTSSALRKQVCVMQAFT